MRRKFSLEKFNRKYPSLKNKEYSIELGDLKLTPQVEDIINARLHETFNKVFEDFYYNSDVKKKGFFNKLFGGKRK